MSEENSKSSRSSRADPFNLALGLVEFVATGDDRQHHEIILGPICVARVTLQIVPRDDGVRISTVFLRPGKAWQQIGSLAMDQLAAIELGRDKDGKGEPLPRRLRQNIAFSAVIGGEKIIPTQLFKTQLDH